MFTKNMLTAADAQLVEAGFSCKLVAFGDEQPGEFSGAAQDSVEEQTRSNQDATEPSTADPKALSIGRGRVATKTIRLRDKDHRKFVSSQPCIICGRTPADAHHLRFAQPRALGRKVSDEFTVPVCRSHHRELHRHGDEASWWKGIKLDPLPIALKLWQHARLVGTAMVVSEGTSTAAKMGPDSTPPPRTQFPAARLRAWPK
jgi:hypothetical protein